MEQNCDDVRQFYREKGQEKPVVLNRCGLEKFSWILASEVVQLVETKDASRSEICPWIRALKSEPFPKLVLQFAMLELLHHFVLLAIGHTGR